MIKDSLFYKKNKRMGYRLTLFMFLAVLMIVAVLPFSLATDRSEADEKKLVSLFPNIYATLMDQNGKIVSTTDPGKEVDNRYASTSSTRYITLNDKLYLYLNAEEVVSENLSEEIIQGEYYYLDLPEYFIPDSENVISSIDDEKELFNMGKIKGYGGVYYENNKYRLKIRFEEITDSYSIEFSYQFSLKLADSINNQDTELKIITVEDIGDLTVYIKKEVEPEENNYRITQGATKKGTSNDIYVLTTTLTDTREESERSTNGKVSISLDTDFGFNSYAQNDYLNAINIYADGELLTKGDSTSKQTTFYNDKVKIIVNATGIVNIGTECTDDANSCLINKLELTITGNTTPNAEGIAEFKVVFDEKLITTRYRNHSNLATFTDALDNNKAFNTNVVVSDQSTSPSLSSSFTDSVYNADSEVPTEMTHNLNISRIPSNYVELTFSRNMYNYYDWFVYFLDSTCFYFNETENTCGNKIKIYIDGNLVSFTNRSLGFSDLYNRSTVTPDSMVYMQMKEVLGSDINLLNDVSKTYLWQSDEPNADGEYYYVVISYNTYNNAYNSSVANGSGRHEYAATPNTNGRITSVPEIKMYLFNTSNHSIKLSFDYKLGSIIRDDERSYYYNHYSYFNSNVKYDYSYSRTSSGSFYPRSKRYMTLFGEALNDNYHKWNVIVDTTEIDKFNTQDITFYIRPDSGEIITYQQDNYSISEKMMVNASKVNGLTLGTDYLQSDSLYVGKYNSTTNKCEGPYTPLALTLLNNSNQYKGLFSSYSYVYSANKGETNIPVIENKMCFVFFTKGYDYYSYDYVNFELDVSGKSRINNSGNDARNIIYRVYGAINKFSNFAKSLTETKINETSTINTWNYYFENVLDYTSCDDRAAVLPYYCSNNYPAYNGNLQFYDKMTGDLAPYTTLNKIKVELYNGNTDEYTTIEMASSELNQLDNKKCVGDTCLHISYPALLCSAGRTEICLTSFYGANYLSTLRKMDNGFSFMLTGVNDPYSVNITYETITDDQEAVRNINSFNSIIETYNSVYNSASAYMEPYSSDDSIWEDASAIFTRKYAAGVAIEKELMGKDETSDENPASKTYLSADTNQYKVSALIGQASIGYLDINDSVSEFSFPSGYYEEEQIKNLRKYLSVDGLTISYKPIATDDDTYETIYENGEFTSEWSNSTITFDENSVNLYSVHLQKTDGTIPPQSSFEINYSLVFDIDNYREIDSLDSYRLNDEYGGTSGHIITDVEAIIPYDTSFATIEDIITSNGRNFIDHENGKVHCFLDETVDGLYLEPSKVSKTAASLSSGEKERIKYTITRETKSAGKPKKPTFNYSDILTFNLNSIPAANREDLNNLLIKHMSISNMEVYDSNGTLIYENENDIPFSENTVNFSSEVINGTFTLNKTDGVVLLTLTGEHEKYDQNVTFSYVVNLNKTAFIEEAIRLNLLDNSLKVPGTSTVFTFYEHNDICIGADLLNPIASASSGRISFSSLSPSLQKTVAYPSTDEQRWTIKTSTNRRIQLVDNLTVNGGEAYASSISIKDLVIKIDNTVIYENNEFVGNYGDYVTINQNGFELKFDFKDEAVSTNTSNIEIQYSTVFDRDAYYEAAGLSTGQYTISNNASIERDGLMSSITTNTRSVNFNYPLVTSKKSLGNDVDLALTKWRIEVTAKDLEKKNITINDTMTLGSEFGSYLSISNMVIKKVIDGQETVIYDYKNNVTALPEGITIKDKELNELDFNTNGEYEFIINVDKLDKDNKLIIDYELSIDEDKYKVDKKDTDVRLNITNSALITSGEESYTNTASGYAVVESIITKEYEVLAVNNNNALISWTINVNLNADYSGTISNDDTVRIIDELFDSLEYVEGSIKVYKRISEGEVNTYQLLTLNEDYEFVYENHTIKVRLLNPKDTSVVYITFNTTCSSTEGLKNYVELQVNGDRIHTGTPVIPPLFLKFIGGTIISKQSALYSIYAKKYYNDELSKRVFKFNLKEVDVLGQTLPSGVNITSENDENGNITFATIKYFESGVHFYKISEINENEANVEYDDKEYILMVQVGEYNNSYLIEKAVILYNDENLDEITFHNVGGETTVEVDKTWNDNNNRDGKRELVNAKVQLYKSINGETPVKVTGNDYLVNVQTQDGNVVKWEHLPVYENGKKITYSVEEEYDSSIGYIATTSDPVEAEIDKVKKITITNNYSSEETSVEVEKTWDDNNNKEGKRESSNAKIQLYKSINGEEPVKVSGSDYLVSVPAKDGVVIRWDHLPVYENKNKITYSVKEELDTTIGYEVDNGTPVEAANGETKKISIKNTLKENTPVEPENNPNGDHTEEEEIHNVPKTGDTIIYSFIALALSIGVLAAILVYFKKNRKQSVK